MDMLGQISTFIEVARMASFARAAENLALPRSTVTARIKALERRLGVALMVRTTRQVVLTAEGRDYLEGCNRALEALAGAEAGIMGKAGIRGLVRLSVPIDFPMQSLARCLAEIRAAHADIRLHVDVSDRVVDLVGENYDLVLRGGAPGNPALIARRIGGAELGFFAPPGLMGPGIGRDELEAMEVLDPTGALGGANGAVVTGNLSLAKALAIALAMPVVLPVHMAQDAVAAGQLMRAESDLQLEPLNLYAVYAARSHLPARVRIVLDQLIAGL